MKFIPLTSKDGRGKFAMVDDEDFERVSQYNWIGELQFGIHYAITRPYIRGSGAKAKRRKIRMHRFILNAPKGILVDHIDHNGINNQRSNLRLATDSQNCQNQRIRKDNTSGYKGVMRDKTGKKWIAKIQFNGKRIESKVFEDIIAAAKEYDKLAKKYFGEFAYTNFA